MKAGTIRSIRVAPLRQGVPLTRAVRQRYLPTKHGHEALRRCVGVIHGYQSDSSSKRPALSVLSGFWRSHT